MNAHVWTRRIQKKVVTTWVMRSIYRDKARTWLARSWWRATRGVRRKLVFAAVGVVAALIVAWQGNPAIAIVPLIAGLVPLLVAAVASLRRTVCVHRIARRVRVPDVPALRQMLRAIGIDDATADRLLTASASNEVRIAAFDQDNRVVSWIGQIPFFGEVLAPTSAFATRSRNVLELVVHKGALCIKKKYLQRSTFEAEVLALDALENAPGVPRLVAIDVRGKVSYQSFMLGQNVGTLIAARGAPVSTQYQVSVSFDSSDRWAEETRAKSRDVAVKALTAAIDGDAIDKLADLVTRIHRSGVTIGDVKYGNVLVIDGEPHLCDFEGATVHQRNDWRCVQARAADREKFDYFFGGELLSERKFQNRVAELVREQPNLFYAPTYYGHGYENRAPGSIELGSGKWLFIQPHLPHIGGKSVLDLGCNNALLPLEMLRAGARRVTAYELNSIVARYARLNHRWFEFVDNASYDGFELVEGYMHDACERDWSGYDIATAFCSLYYEEPAEMARIVRTLSKTIPCFIVQGNENPDEHSGAMLERASRQYLSDLLRANGYADQTIVEFSYYDRPLIIGRRAPA